MDAVYLWGEGSDPAWPERSRAAAEVRAFARGELRHSLRSLERYAPWIDRVVVITDGRRPSWANPGRIDFVRHDQLFPDSRHLPTFNPAALDSHVHRVPGLSRRFLYWNDDCLLGQPISPEDFVDGDGALAVHWGSLGFRGDGRIIDFSEDEEGRELGAAERERLRTELGTALRAMQNATRLLDSAYGPALRRVTAHVPKVIDAEAMTDLQARWPEVFAGNSSHRFPSEQDVDVFFFHANYLLAEAERTGRYRLRVVRPRRDPVLHGTLHVGADPAAVEAFFVRPRLPKLVSITTLPSSTPAAEAALTRGLERCWPERSSFEL